MVRPILFILVVCVIAWSTWCVEMKFIKPFRRRNYVEKEVSGRGGMKKTRTHADVLPHTRTRSTRTFASINACPLAHAFVLDAERLYLSFYVSRFLGEIILSQECYSLVRRWFKKEPVIEEGSRKQFCRIIGLKEDQKSGMPDYSAPELMCGRIIRSVYSCARVCCVCVVSVGHIATTRVGLHVGAGAGVGNVVV